ncbi:MAG: hypothetical protein HY791_15995, partial [Deltaproteobacteria bacterium]|nr:hypothetical protein [Deltaproteobacteria bacterium]
MKTPFKLIPGLLLATASISCSAETKDVGPQVQQPTQVSPRTPKPHDWAAVETAVIGRLPPEADILPILKAKAILVQTRKGRAKIWIKDYRNPKLTYNAFSYSWASGQTPERTLTAKGTLNLTLDEFAGNWSWVDVPMAITFALDGDQWRADSI